MFIFPTNSMQVKLIEAKKMKDLEKKINEFLEDVSKSKLDIYQITFNADNEEYDKHFSAMVIYEKNKED